MITDRTIQANITKAKNHTDKKYKYFPVDLNLWLRVSSKVGRATWLFRIAFPDQTKKFGYKFSYYPIGTYPLLTLRNAKDKAEELNNIVRSGINPMDMKKSETKSQVTLKSVWDKWIAIADIKPITRLKLSGMYNNHVSKLANKPLLSLSDKIVWDTIIQPILNAGNKTQARIVLSKLKQLSLFAYNTHLINVDPFDRLMIPNEYKVKKVRERTLSIEELKIFLISLDKAYLQKIIDIRFHHFIKLVLLLGTRKTELATLKWANTNIENHTILLTGTKSGDDLLIKLPQQATNLFMELHQIHVNDYVFFGMRDNQPIIIRSILYELAKVTKLANITDLTIHDLRRTFSSRLTGLKFRLELIEKATNHRIQGTAKHYQHDSMLDERHEMLQTWADYLDNLILFKN